MQIKYYAKISLTILLVLNILLSLLSVITFGVILKSGYEFYKFNKDISVLKPKWNNIEAVQIKKYEIIRDWYKRTEPILKNFLAATLQWKTLYIKNT